jgi:integrase
MRLLTIALATLVDQPKHEASERKPFTAEQVTRLFTAADDSLAPLLVVSATTGLRQGEALALRWEDVDLDAGTLVV